MRAMELECTTNQFFKFSECDCPFEAESITDLVSKFFTPVGRNFSQLNSPDYCLKLQTKAVFAETNLKTLVGEIQPDLVYRQVPTGSDSVL